MAAGDELESALDAESGSLSGRVSRDAQVSLLFVRSEECQRRPASWS